MGNRDAFLFYRSFRDALREIPPDTRATLYDAIVDYALDGEEPAMNGIAKAMWLLIKPVLDANIKRRENGRKGGNPTLKRKAKDNQPPNHASTDGLTNGSTKVEAKDNQPPNHTSTDDLSDKGQGIKEEENGEGSSSNTPARVKVGKENEWYKQTLLTEQSYWETFAMRFKVPVAQLRRMLETFQLECTCKQTRHENLDRYRSHFFDWARIQIQNEQKQKQYVKQHSDRRGRAESTATCAEDFEGGF